MIKKLQSDLFRNIPDVNEELDDCMETFRLLQESEMKEKLLVSRSGIVHQQKVVEWTKIICDHLKDCENADIIYQGILCFMFN